MLFILPVMVILFISLILLAGCALVIGSALAGFLHIQSGFDRPGDRAIISIWLGIVILANCLYAISLSTPLSPAVTIGFILIASFLALLQRTTRQFPSQLAASAGFTDWCGIAAIGLGVAGYCSQVIIWYDSGLYHLQYIKWLSDIGIVPGIALIHWRLGISSSWFALSAPFNHGFLTGRMFTLTGGFCLLMLLLQAGISLYRIAGRQGRRHDLFMLCATLLVIPVLLVWGMPNSPTADLPVICLEIVTAWAILAITGGSAPQERHNALRSSLTVIILAAGATSMKLSAAPLLAITGLFYLFESGITFKKLLTATATTVIVLAPLAVAGLLVSGCAFFPSTLSCIDAPWSLDRTVVAAKSRIIQDWARWGGAPTPPDAEQWHWLGQWLHAEMVGSALIAVTLVSAVIILCSRRRWAMSDGTVPLIAIGLAGPAFMLCTAPSWRFGLGYLVLLPALALALFCESAIRAACTSSTSAMLCNPALAGIVTALVIVLHSHLVPRPSYRMLDAYFTNNPAVGADHPHFNALLPPRAQNICNEIDQATVTTFAMTPNTLVTGRAVDFTYLRPASAETCWDSPLPCAAETLDGVALRDKLLDIQGGFIRSGDTRQAGGLAMGRVARWIRNQSVVH